MVGILISTIPSMYLFIFTGFWHPPGKNPVPTARELSETMGTSERNTVSERMIKIIFFFTFGFCWHLAGIDTPVQIHTTSNTRQKKAREEEGGVKLEHDTCGEIPAEPLHFIQVFLFSQASLTGITPLQKSTDDKKS